MRFAFKTAPQNTEWADMLALWQADDIDLFESGWTFGHFYLIFSDPTGPCLEGWVTLTGAGPGDNSALARAGMRRSAPPTASSFRRCGNGSTASTRPARS